MTTNENVTYTKGQQVHVLASPNAHFHGGDRWSIGTVVGVGPKYVRVATDSRFGVVTRFHADTGYEVTQYSGNARRFFTDESRSEYEHATAVRRELMDRRLPDVANARLSLAAKAQILAIIKNEESS